MLALGVRSAASTMLVQPLVLTLQQLLARCQRAVLASPILILVSCSTCLLQILASWRQRLYSRAKKAVKCWFEKHCVSQHIETRRFYPAHGQSHYACANDLYAADAAGKEQLYTLIENMHAYGTPLAVVSRQAQFYPLFFDIDIFGGTVSEPSSSRVHQIAWDNDLVLLRSVAQALFHLFFSRDSLEVVVFSSSGFCTESGRFKASFHIMFPQLIVERAVMCWPGHQKAKSGSHLLVRDHVVCHLQESTDISLMTLQDQLLACCSQVALATMADVEGDGEAETALNDWTEVFDENLIWYDQRPGATTGLRLPFTDKIVGSSAEHLEHRPKIPLGRWEVRRDCEKTGTIDSLSVQELPSLPSVVDWIRLGDLSRDWHHEAFPVDIDTSKLHPDVQLEVELRDGTCICPVCRGRC